MSDFRYYRPDTFPPIVKNLIIINAIVFVAGIAFQKQYDLTGLLMLWPLPSDAFAPYQIATHMFAHASLGHLFFNMLGLWMFGRMLENAWGPKRFLLFYFVCGIGAAAVHLVMQYLRWENGASEIIGPMLGASGAIMGVMAGVAYLFPNTEIYLYMLFPIKAKWLVIVLALLDLYGGFVGTGDRIAHFAHLGGALTGFILVLIWNKTNRRRFY